MLFALINCGPILSDRAEGVNRQVLPVFWRFCPIAKSVGGRQRPSGQAMREKQRDSVANRAGGGRCRAQARLQTGLENNGLTDRKLPFARPPVLSAARVAVEEALIHEIHANPNFKLKFSRCSLRDMSELIAYFKDYGRDYLVLYRTEICFEDDPRRVREAYATNRRMAERLVSIIGRDQFRSCVNRFLIRIHAGQPVREAF